MKGLYKRRQGWWIRFTPIPGAPQIRVALGTIKEAEAIVRAEEIMNRAATTAREELESCEVEIAAYLKQKKEEGLSASTLTSRRYVLQSFVSMMEITCPRNITRQCLQKWFDHHRKSNPHTAVAYMHLVHCWLKWMVERGKLARDVTKEIKMPKLPMRRRRNFLLPAQAQKLLDASEGNPGLKFALYCGLHAGLRKLEIIEARPNWFDLDGRLLHIQATDTFQPKDRDNRTVPLTDEFIQWLRNNYTIKEPFMLEPEVKHGAYRYRFDFRTSFENIATRCGFEKLTFHDLRRTFASLHVSRGTSIYKVARWLGDRVDVVEDHYGHLIPNDSEINSVWNKKSSS